MRSKNYPPMNEQIKEFPAFTLFGSRLVKIFLEDTNGYNHDFNHLHHFILEQEYYNCPERYKGEQKLILLDKKLHADLHSAMSDKRFYNKYKVEKDYLWQRHRKVDAGFWDKDGNYKEDLQIIDEREMNYDLYN